MKSGRMAQRRFISLSLSGQHMNKNWPLKTLRFLKDPHHLMNIVSVHRPKVGDPHVLEKHPRDHNLLDAALGLPNRVHHPRTDLRDLFQRPGHAHFQFRIRCRRPDSAQVSGNPADIF